jgi:hypothetical protein
MVWLHEQVQALAVPVFETAAAAVTTAATSAIPEGLKAFISPLGLAIVAFALGLLWLKRILDTPSRTYDPNAPNVGEEYDAWTQCDPCSPPEHLGRRVDMRVENMFMYQSFIWCQTAALCSLPCRAPW